MRLRIEKAVYGGAGLARSDGKAVFVPMALPGEEVEAALRRDKGSFAEAELLEILQPSPDRVVPPCPYYGACGGCQYQHASYPAQLAMKRAILGETLGRAGLRELPAVETHSAEPWAYRNRIRLHVDPETHALGYRRRGSHALLPVEACPIAVPVLAESLPGVQRVFAGLKSGVWCAEAELFAAGEGGEIALSLRQRAGARLPAGALERLCEALMRELPRLAGAAVFAAAPVQNVPTGGRGARRGGVQKGGVARPGGLLVDAADGETAMGVALRRWGKAALVYGVGGIEYRTSLGTFFQSNIRLVERLRALATDGRRGTLAWDLFAGVGLFARALLPGFAQVAAVEGSPISCADLRENLLGLGRRDRVVESSTLAFLQREAQGLAGAGGARTRAKEHAEKQAASRGGPARPDLVVLDPPRAGLGVEASGLLARFGAREITYVSCDPATLARDLKVMVDAGYTISQLHLLDMFPQTFHMETVAVLHLD